MEDNASCGEGLTFGEGAYNPNHYGSSGHPAAMNNLAQVMSLLLHRRTGQARSGQAAIFWLLLTSSRWELASSSYAAWLMEGDWEPHGLD